MKNGTIWFRFKSEKNFSSLAIVGESITIKDLKSKIKERIHEKGNSLILSLSGNPILQASLKKKIKSISSSTMSKAIFVTCFVV